VNACPKPLACEAVRPEESTSTLEQLPGDAASALTWWLSESIALTLAESVAAGSRARDRIPALDVSAPPYPLRTSALAEAMSGAQ